MRMVTINITNAEWVDFTQWCNRLSVKYKRIYNYDDAILVKVPAWFCLQWLQGEPDEDAACFSTVEEESK